MMMRERRILVELVVHKPHVSNKSIHGNSEINHIAHFLRMVVVNKNCI